MDLGCFLHFGFPFVIVFGLNFLILKFVIKYQRQVFQIGLYYLNFNRIDMKKELRSRIKNSRNQHKSENQTKPSEKKQRRPRARPSTGIPNVSQVDQPSRSPEPAHEAIMKDSALCCETAADTPYNVSLDHYIDDICEHITELDRSFQLQLSRGLKAAGNIQITSEMRKILLKWLIKVGRKFRVRSQTLHMCVQLIDYMLIHKGPHFTRTNFQLLGITSLFISCKYNEIYTIESQKYLQFCDGIYSITQLFQMQSYILSSINFNLQIPTLHQFINKIQLECHISMGGQCETLIRGLMDLVLFDFNCFNQFRKYELGVGIVYFVSKLYKLDGLKASLLGFKSKIEPEVFRECFLAVVGVFKRGHGQAGLATAVGANISI